MSPRAQVHDQETLRLLIDNIHQLDYTAPGVSAVIKLPYFQDRFSANPSGVNEVKKRFCEAIVQLLEKHGRLR